jgi:hypothetical protein
MQNALRRIIVMLAFAASVGTAHGLAAQVSSPTHANQAAQQPTTASGELLRVNADAKTFAIKAADGAEMQFQYTDATQVTGAEKGTAGLATMKGAQVTVYFSAEGKVLTATKIDVHAAS